LIPGVSQRDLAKKSRKGEKGGCSESLSDDLAVLELFAEFLPLGLERLAVPAPRRVELDQHVVLSVVDLMTQADM